MRKSAYAAKFPHVETRFGPLNVFLDLSWLDMIIRSTGMYQADEIVKNIAYVKGDFLVDPQNTIPYP